MNSKSYKGKKYSKGNFPEVDDLLTVEESLKITINQAPFTVTMRTPGHEAELVRGLLFSENVYTDLISHPVIAVKEKNNSGTVTWMDVAIPADKIGKGFGITRSIASVSSCGVCGKTELQESSSAPLSATGEQLYPELVGKMFSQMSSKQELFKKSGGSHACAAFSQEGKMLSIREDIGRHNAVDKVIGDLIIQKKLSQARCLTVSGRISYEIVNKCFAAGIPFLASVSAPSSLAVDMAEQMGITLLAFCRDKKFTVYSHSSRIKI
ncbi:MAG TPA: formate dehydrogenase accessory sulfurtransferase FdhD [Bacteroidia bacterium]